MGKTLPWRRDDVDLYEFHLDVPEGVTTLHAHLDCIVTARVSQKLAVLEWEKLLLYPAHTPVRDIPDPAVAQGSRGMGRRHRAYAGRFGLLSGSGRREHDRIRGDQC